MRKVIVAVGAALILTTPALAQDWGSRSKGSSLSTRKTVPLPPRRMQVGSVHAIVTQAAARHGVPNALAHAVIRSESNYNCSAKNPNSTASGLGQLIRGTARSLGVRNVMNCAENANGAMAYLGRMYRAAGGNACAAATGYNRGSVGGCSSYGRMILSRMTG